MNPVREKMQPRGAQAQRKKGDGNAIAREKEIVGRERELSQFLRGINSLSSGSGPGHRPRIDYRRNNTVPFSLYRGALITSHRFTGPALAFSIGSWNEPRAWASSCSCIQLICETTQRVMVGGLPSLLPLSPYPNSPCFLVSTRWNDYRVHGWLWRLCRSRREVKVNPCASEREWEERRRKDIREGMTNGK